MAKIFISYSHDSDEHKRRVRSPADQLRERGFDAIIDQYVGVGGPEAGWSRWAESHHRYGGEPGMENRWQFDIVGGPGASGVS